VLSEFERILAKSQFKVIIKQLESTLAPDLRTLEPPKARSTSLTLMRRSQPQVRSWPIFLNAFPNPASSLSASSTMMPTVFRSCVSRERPPHLCRGPRPVNPRSSARRRGGFWVPRQLLSGFVDSILTGQGRRLKTDSVTNLSRREQEVLDSLLENLSNKEIASKLNIAERTVKFHVSNLLNKFGVRRRADLILLTFQRRLSQV